MFILLCGSTHFFSIWVLWNTDYGYEGIVKVLTAIASVITAALVCKIMPMALGMLLANLMKTRKENTETAAGI